jgi:hypothetical protein
LNHIGPKLFQEQCWNGLERLTPQDKLNVIAEKIGQPIDYGKRPWGIMKELFGFRNDVAHGKSIKVAKTRLVPISKHDSDMREFEKTAWEAFCTRQNAERARKDVEKMVVILHEKARIADEYPFVSGWQDTLATLVEDAT